MVGITVDDTGQSISGNIIKKCRIGISLYPPGSNNNVYGNNIEDCYVGVKSENAGRNTITKNNFRNYSWIKGWALAWGGWFSKAFTISFSGFIIYLIQKDTWVGNYWDTWKGIGSEIILGKLTIGRYILGYPQYITIPWIDRDWQPAKEPYMI